MNIHILAFCYFIAITGLFLGFFRVLYIIFKNRIIPEKINIKIDSTHVIGLTLYLYSIWEIFIR
jgi:hypothetical protein